MKYSQFLAGAAVASVAVAHTTITNMWVNDVDQGAGNTAAGYIRTPPSNSPVKDIDSKDMTCNVNNVATAKTIEVAAGAKLTLEWHHNSNSPSDDIIDKSHLGPVIAYIAPTASNGAGDVWVKLAEDGYDGSKWAVEKLIANKGKQDVTLPSTLADGEYLVRGEIIALHEADAAFSTNPGRGAQFYMECVQIKVTGGGATTLPAGVAIPGTYKYTDPGIVFSLYSGFTSYTIPGPPVFNGTSSGGVPPPPPPPAASTVPVASSPPTPTPTPSSAPPPVINAPVPTPKKSACKSKSPTPTPTPTPSSAPPPPVINAPVPTPKKSACKSKNPTPTPKPSKSACKSKSKPPVAGPTTMATVSTKAPVASGAPFGTVAKYGQCGGLNYKGSKTCAAGSTCKNYNPYYSQCI